MVGAFFSWSTACRCISELHSQNGGQEGVGVGLEIVVDQEVMEGVVPLDQEADERHHHLYWHLLQDIVGNDVGA